MKQWIKGDTHTHGENLYVYEPMVKGDRYTHTHTEKTYVSMNQWIKEIHINTQTHTQIHTPPAGQPGPWLP